MKAAVIAMALLATLASANAAAYVANVAYLAAPLPGNTNYTAETNQTALLTVAELNQNATTSVTSFDWELVFTPDPSKSSPVRLDLVAYHAAGQPANGAVIINLASNPNGLALGSADVQGIVDYPTMAAAYASAGLSLPVCEPGNPCTPGPGSMNFVADNTIAVLTYADGKVTSGFLQQTPTIPSPPVSNDDFYVADTNGSFAVPPTAALLTSNDTVDIAIFNNFDDQRSWGIIALTQFYNTTGAQVTGFSVVSLVNNVPKTILSLNSAVAWTDPSLADTGYENDTALFYPQILAGMATAGLKTPTELFGAVYITANSQSYVNYMHFQPSWIQDPTPPSPPPSPPSPPPAPKRSPVHRASPKHKPSPKPVVHRSPPKKKPAPKHG